MSSGGESAIAVRQAAVIMLGVLGSLASAIALRAALGLSVQVPVLAVVLALTLARVPHEGARERLGAAIEVPVVALAAAGVGLLVFRQPWVGQPLLVVGLSVGILLRRWGAVSRRAGRLITLPFIALLVTPVPVTSHATSSILWAPVVALIALLWTMVVAALTSRWVVVPAEESSSAPPRAGRRLDAPIRMAAQMAVGVGAALAVGHALFGDRWSWTVLSAYLVASGNRGRGDVVHKAGLRMLGAAAGTAIATLVGSALPPGHRSTLVALFGVLAVALVLRGRSYAWWAAGVTAMVALLHSYFGESAAGAVDERLLGVLVGAVIGVAAAWFVLPVRTRDVFRRRIADCLAALTDDLGAAPGPDVPAFPAAVAQLDQLVPPLRAHTRFDHDAPSADLLHAIRALHSLEPLPRDPDDRRLLRRDVVRVRRAMIGRDHPRREELPNSLFAVHSALQHR